MNVCIDHWASSLLSFRNSAVANFTGTDKGAGQRSSAREPENSPTGRSGFRRFMMTHAIYWHSLVN